MPRIAPVALSALLLAGAAIAQQFTISQPVGSDTFGSRSRGQTITPNVGITPNPGPQGVLPLTQVTFYQGNLGATTPSTTTFLHVYLGDPGNGGAFLGSSTNSVDTTAPVYRTPMVWTFAQVSMVYTSEHWLVMSSTPSGAPDVECSLETAPRNGPNVYTGGAGLIANIAQHPNSVDARFEVEFFLGVQGSFTTSGAGCAGSGGVLSLSSATVPTVGQTLVIDMNNTGSLAFASLALGFSDTIWNGLPLPLALAALLPGTDPTCQILISPDATVGMAQAGSTASASLPIPNQPALIGLSLFVQGAQIEVTGVSTSDKGSILVGN